MPRRPFLTLVFCGTSLLLFIIYASSSTASSQRSIRKVQESYMATIDKHLNSFSTSFTKPDSAIGQQTYHQPLNWSKVATVIETRESVIMVPILQSWLANMPKDWPFVVWTGRENHKVLTDSVAFKDEIASGRLNFTRIDFAGSAYRPNPSEPSTLSDLLANSNWFWSQYHKEAEWMLFFQLDSVLCSKSDQTVDDWIGYDFVGGPADWTHDPEKSPRVRGHGGNGGLSLRKISSMKAITEKKPRKKDGPPEDVHFVWELEGRNGTRWPEDEGRRQAAFSMSQGWMEDYTNDMDWKPLGLHYGLRHLGHIFKPTASGIITNPLHRIIHHCPEILYLNYLHEEYQDVEMSMFRPGAKPRPTDNDDLIRLDRQHDIETSKLKDTIDVLGERLKKLEKQIGQEDSVQTQTKAVTLSDSASSMAEEQIPLVDSKDEKSLSKVSEETADHPPSSPTANVIASASIRVPIIAHDSVDSNSTESSETDRGVLVSDRD